MRNMQPPRIPDDPPELLSREKLRAVLKACSGKSFESVRDSAMLRMLVDSGMRRGELAGIKVSDIDWDESVVTVLGKGRPAPTREKSSS
jgi:site-specific recombinase XerD